MDRYYTPEIEEFHVGFECEINHKVRDGSGDRTWEKEIVKFSQPYMDFLKYLFDKEPENIRVKHLDREDIESLGFELRTTSYGVYYMLGVLCRLENDYKKDWIISRHEGERNPMSILFNGSIKNKSEFKKLLVQLDIR